MIGKILFYELRQRFFNWTTLLFYLMMVFQGIWYTKGNFDFYVNADLYINSPSVFYKNLAGIGMLMVIIVAIVTGTSLYKDIQYKTGQWIYTLPINEKQFYMARFLSALLFNVFIASGYVIGMILVPFSGIGEAHQFGPLPLGQLLHGFVFLTVPNLFLLTSLVFFALVFTKKMAVGYLSILITVVAFLIMQTTSEASGITDLLAIGDPFGFVATEEQNLAFTSFERNTAYLPLDGNLAINRGVWSVIALLLLVVSTLKFSFKGFSTSKKKVKKLMAKPESEATMVNKNIVRQTLDFGQTAYLRKLFSLAVLEFKNVVRPVSFKVILGIILLMAVLQNLVWNASYYIGPTAPLTSTMTFFRLSFGIFIMILIMVWSGELFFKERTVKIHYITDTLPVPVWVTRLSRFFAMTAVSFVLALSFMVIGILIQIVKGGVGLIEMDLYLYDILGYNWGWLTYVLWIALVFFVSGVTGNRFLTHVLSVGAFFVMIMAFELGLAEQTRFAYTAVPGLEDYSEISGYGIWKASALWYFLMWTLLAMTFLLLGIYFWQRGTSVNWSRKLGFRGKQLNPMGKVAAIVLLIGFFGLQVFNKYQTTGLENFTPSEVEKLEAADYEKRFGYLKEIEHPKYSKVDLQLDLFPDKRKASYEAEIELQYLGTSAQDTLTLNYENFLTMEPLKSSTHGIHLIAVDSIHSVYRYKIEPPLKQGDSLKLSLKGKRQYVGFSQGGEQPQIDITYNGSFGSVRKFLPVIGYDDNRELDENRQREEQGLPRLSSRMSKVSDAIESYNDFLARDAFKVSGEITISTAAEQTPIAPGNLEKEWGENGRTYRKYTIDRPSAFIWYVASATYESAPTTVGNTKVQILSSPKHTFHKALFQKTVAEGITFINDHFGSYPYKELQVVEIPYYDDKFYAFPNTIAISEKEGWYADVSNIKEQAYIKHSLYSQLIKQWLSDQVTVANVQGAETLYHSLPQALALFCVEETLGEEAVGHLLQRKNDFYAKEKNKEANTEPSVALNDGAEYITDGKAVIELFRQIEKMGKINFIKKLLNWTEENKGTPVVYPNFIFN